MTENTLNPEKTSVPADLPHNPLIEEMQALLHKFAEGESQRNESNASDPTAQNPEEPKEAAGDLPHNPLLDEMQALLRKFAEENVMNKSDASDQAAQKPEAPQETTEDSAPEKDAKTEIAELKALVHKLVEEKARNSRNDDDDDECDGDDDFDGDYDWSPGPEWETIGYVAGGAALVGLGALLYHWLQKDD